MKYEIFYQDKEAFGLAYKQYGSCNDFNDAVKMYAGAVLQHGTKNVQLFTQIKFEFVDLTTNVIDTTKRIDVKFKFMGAES
ncbi:hypothetical protein LCGC14_0504080 [marine sediment metagenome]|uniref:Uncharacterized protein n=1 Tax=marine sediment metagenome TaxID=412755 RepID=A0A0F9VBM2_9ZZZZ